MDNQEISSTRSGASATTPAPSPFPVPDKAGAGYFAMNGGWIKLHRKIIDGPLWVGEPFTRGQAWVDLLLIANHKPGYFRSRGVRVDVDRGQTGYALETLANRWMWSRGKVVRFLRELETEGQLVTQKTNVTTIITICNYDQYQENGQQIDTQTDSKRTANGQQTVRQTDTNKKVKNDKKVKNEKNNTTDAIAPGDQVAFIKFQKWISEHAPRVAEMKNPFTASEFLAAKKSIPTNDITALLTEMHNYKPLLSKNISAYLTLCNWHRRRRESGQAPVQHKPLSAAEAADKIDRKWKETIEGAR